MSAKQMCIANVQYKKPTADDAKRHNSLLRYLTYRDGRYGHIQQQSGMERWIDHGLGGSISDISVRCDALKSDHVLAFTLVFNTNPELIAMVPLECREPFVKELTETSLERFFEARGVEGGIEYSYVMHHRESENPQSPGLHDPHTHVLLPGTCFNENAGEREPLYFSRNKKVNHIDLLHRITEQTMRELMEREVGRDWEQRYDALELAREQQRQVNEAEPNGTLVDAQGREWEGRIGERCTDKAHTAVGYYRYFPKDSKSKQETFTPEEMELEFRPVVSQLSHESAHLLTLWLQQSMKDHPEQTLAQGLQFLADFNKLSAEVRESYLEDMAQQLRALDAEQRIAHNPQPLPDAPTVEIDRDDPSYGFEVDFF